MSQNRKASDAAKLFQKKESHLPIDQLQKIKTKEGKAVKPGQLFGTRQHNHATVCLVSKSIKNYHIQIITHSLSRIWRSHGDVAADGVFLDVKLCQPANSYRRYKGM
jgi:hypothetical protein